VWLAARFVAPWLDVRRRARLSRWLSMRALAMIGVRLETCGDTTGDGAALLVANHVSWLDVQVLNALRPARFVAKAETRTWPICGGIAAGFDTMFLERGSLRDAARVKARIAEALAAGHSVAVFPEGSTTDGRTLGRFYAALFEAAIEAGVPVRPVAIRYPRADGRANLAPAFVDDMTFLESLVQVAREPDLRARVTMASPLATAGASRRELAARSRRFIAESLGLSAWGGPSEHVARLPPPGWRSDGRRARPLPRINWPQSGRRPPRPLVPPAVA
jgi:1-acyl-sn-glycerol-3-phosphate acyltransferase